MKAFRIAAVLVLAAALLVGAAGCNKDEDVAARVNGEEISKAELDAQIAKLEEQYPQMFEGADAEGRILDFKQRLLDNLINAMLIRQAAAERGIEVTDEDVQKQIDQLKQSFQSEEDFLAQLEQAGMDEATLEQQVRDQIITEQLIAQLTEDVEISDEDIAKYYESNKAQFLEPAAVHTAHILFEAGDRETAEQVLAELRAGGDFASLAKQYSTDSASAAKGGDLGWPTMPLDATFEAAANALEPGEISDIVETSFGLHIIKLIEKREEKQKTLEEATEQIKQILAQQHNADVYQKFLDEQRAKAKIEILIPELAVPISQPASGTAEPSDSGK